MKHYFQTLANQLFDQLEQGEVLALSFYGETSTFVRFNRSAIRQASRINDFSLSLQLYANGRTCLHAFTLTLGEAIDELKAIQVLHRLREQTAVLPEDPYAKPPAAPMATSTALEGELPAPEQALDLLFSSFPEESLVGLWAAGQIYRGNATSVGAFHWFQTDSFTLDATQVVTGERMGKLTFAGRRWDSEALKRYLEQQARYFEILKQPARKLVPGSYRAYIAPPGVQDLVAMLNWYGLSEASFRQGESALLAMRREGKTLSEKFNLWQDFLRVPVPIFNERGEAAPDRLPLIVKGRLENTLISERTAAEHGLQTNYADLDETIRAPYLEGGSLDEAQVLTALGTGLYLSNLHYLNWSDRPGARVTGMTRYACLWVENGEPVAPIENLRFDDTLYHLFGDNLEDLTKQTAELPETSTYQGRQPGGMVVPGMLVKAMQFTL